MPTLPDFGTRPLAPPLVWHERLPGTLPSSTHKFRVGKYEGSITIGFCDDGRAAEVFIKIAEHGSTNSGFLSVIAGSTNLAVQYGVPIEVLAYDFEFTGSEPAGWTSNPELRHVNSLVDYVFRWLGIQGSEKYRVVRVSLIDLGDN